MSAILIIVVILVILLCGIFKKARQRIAIITGPAIIVLSFFAFLLSVFLVPEIAELLIALIIIFDISIIAFFILWNIKDTKKVYRLLSVPALCILTGIAVLGYNHYVDEIPTVHEDFRYYMYMPSRKDNILAKLDAQSNYKITDNFPALDGATALFPVYSSFVLAVYPESEYDKSDSKGTNFAYEHLLNEKVDLIFCAEPSDLQLQKFIDNGKDLKLIPIGKEAFVFFVNKKNQVSNLTIDDIQGIYSGKIINWKQLNGKNQQIKAFQRSKNSGSQTILEKTMGNIPIIDSPTEKVQSMDGIIDQVANYRNFSNAIGYSFLFYATEMEKNDQIKFLSINGIYPSRETIQNNSYPFSDYFYAIYIDTEDKNEHIEPFIEWILSEQGQKLIADTGYTPITN